jgi:hypothetical protein
MDPINYSGSLIGLTQDPAQALMGGLKTGAAVADLQYQSQQRELQQQALQRQQTDLSALMANPNPTAQDYANYTMRNPQAADATKQAFTLLDEQRQKQTIGVASKVYSALQAGRADLADQILEAQEQAHANGGNPGDLESTKVLRELVKTDPKQATQMAGLFLSSAMGSKNFAGAFGAIGKEARDSEAFPVAQQQAQANLADTKGQTAARETELGYKAQELEIKRDDTKIKALTAQLGKETNELKKQELQGKLNDAQAARDQKQTDKVAKYQAITSKVDDALDNIARIRNAPGLEGNFGVRGAIPNIPGTEEADAAAAIENLKGKAFMAAYEGLKGGGPITDIEGTKGADAMAALGKSQSKESFLKNLDIMEKILKDNKERMAFETGQVNKGYDAVAIAKHPVYGDITQARIDAIATKAGLTKEQKAELVTRLQQGGQ